MAPPIAIGGSVASGRGQDRRSLATRVAEKGHELLIVVIHHFLRRIGGELGKGPYGFGAGFFD